MDGYDIVANIGKGSSGSVFLARSNASKKLVAIKKIEIDENRRSKSKKSVVREATILRRLYHPCIVECEEWFLDQEEKMMNIVLEYCDGGTMQELVRKARSQNNNYFPEEKILKWMAEVTSAVAFMHERKILHRDLKTENVFIVKPDNAKLGDFGISKEIDHTLDMAQTCVGTPCYLSPELCQDIPYSSKSDVWALGCLLFEMAALKPAFDGANLVSLFYKIVKGDFAELPAQSPKALHDLVSMILQKNPDDRPTAEDLLQHHALVKYTEVIKSLRKKSSPLKKQMTSRALDETKAPHDIGDPGNERVEIPISMCESQDTITGDSLLGTVSPGPIQAYNMFLSYNQSSSDNKYLEMSKLVRLPPINSTKRSNSVLETTACRNAVISEVPKLFDNDTSEDPVLTGSYENTDIETARPQTCPHSATRREAVSHTEDPSFTDTVVTWSGYGDRGSRRPSGRSRRLDSISLSSGSDDDSGGNGPSVQTARSEVYGLTRRSADYEEYSDSNLSFDDDDSDLSEEFIRDEQGDDEIPEVIEGGADDWSVDRRANGDSSHRLPGSAWFGMKKLQTSDQGADGPKDNSKGQQRRKMRLPGSSWLSRSKVPGAQPESSSDDAIVLGEGQGNRTDVNSVASKQKNRKKAGKRRELPGSAWLKSSDPVMKRDETSTTNGDPRGVGALGPKQRSMVLESCSSSANELSSPEKKSSSYHAADYASDYSYSDDFDDYDDDFELSDSDTHECAADSQKQKSSLDVVRQGCIDMLGESTFEDLSAFFKRGLTLSQVITKFKGKKLNNETVETCYLLLQNK